MSSILRPSWTVFLVVWRAIPALILAVFFSGCSGTSDSQAPATEVTFRFSMRGDDVGAEDFMAVTSKENIVTLARSQLSVPDSARTLHINGPIERGNGGHNLSWGWHFVPDAWILTGSSVELCDGGPQAVENDIDYWVDTVKTFCPWTSYVSEEVSNPQ